MIIKNSANSVVIINGNGVLKCSNSYDSSSIYLFIVNSLNMWVHIMEMQYSRKMLLLFFPEAWIPECH